MFGLSVARGQTHDTSGNALLKGNYAFRNVAVTAEDSNNNPTEVTATYGTIAFDGAGKYTITGTQVDNTVASGTPQTYKALGTYAIRANGTGYVSSPLYPLDNSGLTYEYGAVSQGVFTGSATESGSKYQLNDIFVAIPVASAPPTSASFVSVYQTGLLDFMGGSSAVIKNALFNVSPNGKGGLGAISLTGQASNQTNPKLTQTISGAIYSFNNDGSATLTVPLPAGLNSTDALFAGFKTIFESADGNFILGWTAAGYDILFGVKALASTATNALSQGLYFTAALEDHTTAWGTGSYHGSEYNTGNANGDAIEHQRLNAYGIYGPGSGVDYGSDDLVELNSDGTTQTDYNGYEYVFGVGGQAYVGIGTGGYYSLVVGLHAASFSGSGVFINPITVYNAASYQPITARLTPGELVTLFGTGLASTAAAVQGGQTVPTTLGGVSATLNGIQCPVFAVNPTQVSILVPYELVNKGTPYADIQLTSNGIRSNVVQMYFQDSAPGSFSQTQNGVGFAAARHAITGLPITQSNPAQPGEYVSLYLTGLGTVTPTITDGALGPSRALSTSDEWNGGYLQVFFNDYKNGSVGNSGTIQFVGLAPGLAGLYQINVQVPTGVLGSGDDVEIEFLTDSADVTQIYIPYGSGAPTPLLRTARAQVRAARAAAIRSSRLVRSKKKSYGLRLALPGDNLKQ